MPPISQSVRYRQGFLIKNFNKSNGVAFGGYINKAIRAARCDDDKRVCAMKSAHILSTWSMTLLVTQSPASAPTISRKRSLVVITSSNEMVIRAPLALKGSLSKLQIDCKYNSRWLCHTASAVAEETPAATSHGQTILRWLPRPAQEPNYLLRTILKTDSRKDFASACIQVSKDCCNFDLLLSRNDTSL